MADRERRDGEDRLYLGNLPRDTTKDDMDEFFGKTEVEKNIVDIKLLGVYGFAQCKSAQIAKELIPRLHGKMLKGQRVSVQMAKGSRAPRGDNFPPQVHTKRTPYRMIVSGLPETSWQDLKDFARSAHVDVSFSEIQPNGDGLVEFTSEAALHTAVKALDQKQYRAKGDEFRTNTVQCKIDTNGVHAPPPPPRRGRSRSPPRAYHSGYRSPHSRYSPPYGGRGRSPPRGGGGYRERSPARYRDYDYREPVPRGYTPPPPPPPRRYRDDPYPPPPPRRDYRDDYDDKYKSYPPRPRSPGRRELSPPRDYDRRYERREREYHDRRH